MVAALAYYPALYRNRPHRVLVNSKVAQRMAAKAALVSAKKLLHLSGISQPKPKDGCTYIHLIFEDHEVIQANGCWSESFYPGDQALLALPQKLAQEYADIFGQDSGPNCPIINGKKAQNLIHRHQKNSKELQITQQSSAN